jgi:hypothetical protein
MSTEAVLLIFGLGLAAGVFVGWNARHWWWQITVAYRAMTGGPCLRYRFGPREERNGTSSNFCLRCGHPAGSHPYL